jgi:hypothetical protein
MKEASNIYLLTISPVEQSLEKSGISDEDRLKIIGLKQFILKGEKSWRSQSQKDLSIPETSQPISLKDLGVTPYTVFLNPPNFSAAPFYMVNTEANSTISENINSDFGETESDTSTQRNFSPSVPVSIAHRQNSFSYSLQRSGSSQSSLAKKSWFFNFNILSSDSNPQSPGQERRSSSIQNRVSKPATPSPTKASKISAASAPAPHEINGLILILLNL